MNYTFTLFADFLSLFFTLLLLTVFLPFTPPTAFALPPILIRMSTTTRITTMATTIRITIAATDIQNPEAMMQGLALVDVGGLIAATILTLILLPTYYRLVHNMGRKAVGEDVPMVSD